MLARFDGVGCVVKYALPERGKLLRFKAQPSHNRRPFLLPAALLPRE
jgi:hypothetical protein